MVRKHTLARQDVLHAPDTRRSHVMPPLLGIAIEPRWFGSGAELGG